MTDKQIQEMVESLPEKKFLEIETKYDATDIDRIKFKVLARGLNPTRFIYGEGTDIYFIKAADDFLRYRMPMVNSDDKRSELTFKKKSTKNNNMIRTEVNLRIDMNNAELVSAFCEGIGYKKNFSVYKMFDIYFFEDANIVYYSVLDDTGKTANFIEIEASEEIGLTEDKAWEVVQKYEKLLAPMGISAQKRKKLSLFEMYRKEL
jgi:predicted adenylyl cyclase CyaB